MAIVLTLSRYPVAPPSWETGISTNWMPNKKLVINSHFFRIKKYLIRFSMPYIGVLHSHSLYFCQRPRVVERPSWTAFIVVRKWLGIRKNDGRTDWLTNAHRNELLHVKNVWNLLVNHSFCFIAHKVWKKAEALENLFNLFISTCVKLQCTWPYFVETQDWQMELKGRMEQRIYRGSAPIVYQGIPRPYHEFQEDQDLATERWLPWRNEIH